MSEFDPSEPNTLLVDRLEALARDALALPSILGAWGVGVGAGEDDADERHIGSAAGKAVYMVAERLRTNPGEDVPDPADEIDFSAWVLCALADQIGFNDPDPDDSDYDINADPSVRRTDRWQGLRR